MVTKLTSSLSATGHDSTLHRALARAPPSFKSRHLTTLNAKQDLKKRSCFAFAQRTGLEPATSRVTGGDSNQIELPLHRVDSNKKYYFCPSVEGGN